MDARAGYRVACVGSVRLRMPGALIYDAPGFRLDPKLLIFHGLYNTSGVKNTCQIMTVIPFKGVSNDRF